MQIKMLLVGVLKNGYYYDDGSATILALMAYSQSRLNKHKKSEESIIEGGKIAATSMENGIRNLNRSNRKQ